MNLASYVKEARATAMLACMDAGGYSKILFYPDTQPSTPGGTFSGTLIATLNLDNPAGTVATVTGVTKTTLTASVPCQAVSADTIRWARIVDHSGTWIADFKVRLATDSDASSAEIIIDIATVYVGAFINLVSAVITEG